MQISMLTLAILAELGLLLLLTNLALVWYVLRQRTLLRNQQTQLESLSRVKKTEDSHTAPPSITGDDALRAALAQNQAALEEYRARYEALEKRWHRSYADAQQLLLQHAQRDTEPWQALLLAYQQEYQREYQQEPQQLAAQPVSTPYSITLPSSAHRATEDSLRLRNLATDRYRQIQQLQRRLKEAESIHEKAQLADVLEQQLQHQVHLLQEADTCIQLLENELDLAHKALAQQAQLPS